MWTSACTATATVIRKSGAIRRLAAWRFLMRDWTDERAAALTAAMEEESRFVFDLSTPPLTRTRLLRLAPDEAVLISNQHHIISDGWSRDLFARELALAYAAFRAESRSLRVAERGESLLALAALVSAYGVGEVAGGYGFLAVFACAMTFRSAERTHDYHAAMHEVAERLERLLTLFVLLVLGIALSRGDLSNDAEVNPSVDAIAEFKLITNNYSAEYAHAMGGVTSFTSTSTHTACVSAGCFIRRLTPHARNASGRTVNALTIAAGRRKSHRTFIGTTVVF